jgi:Flp pilus assembly protein TadG
VSITNAAGDTTGTLGAATVALEGRFGTLRTYYNDTRNVKTIFNGNIGTVDYATGVVTLNAFNPLNVDNPLGQLTLTANPTSTIVSSSYNRIITVDEFDPQSIIVNVTAKTT